MREINTVIIHCSASKNFEEVTLETINKWHKARGFLDKASGISCGYHFLVQPSGRVDSGRPISSVGAHVRGYNKDSIGVCIIGNGLTTEQQFIKSIALCRTLMVEYDLSPADFHGHYEYTKLKTCLNFDMRMFRALLYA